MSLAKFKNASPMKIQCVRKNLCNFNNFNVSHNLKYIFIIVSTVSVFQINFLFYLRFNFTMCPG